MMPEKFITLSDEIGNFLPTRVKTCMKNYDKHALDKSNI